MSIYLFFSDDQWSPLIQSINVLGYPLTIFDCIVGQVITVDYQCIRQNNMHIIFCNPCREGSLTVPRTIRELSLQFSFFFLYSLFFNFYIWAGMGTRPYNSIILLIFNLHHIFVGAIHELPTGEHTSPIQMLTTHIPIIFKSTID